jgi:hypothetical protein
MSVEWVGCLLCCEEDFHKVWELRTVHRFAEYFGLVELRPDPEPPASRVPYLESWQLRKTPLLDQAVQWKVSRK